MVDLSCHTLRKIFFLKMKLIKIIIVIFLQVHMYENLLNDDFNKSTYYKLCLDSFRD